ncbi:MAG: serine/threonine protein kinase [Gemmatimonadales bacterium]|nr:serine/threonine protein kinase [Gemmatimonadales bacterium]
MTADTSRWQRLRTIFDELVELPPAEQDRRLEALPAEELELRAEIRSLLQAERRAGNRFEHAPTLADEFSDILPDDPKPGARIGPYRVAREIGRGGMGAVYEAFRDDAAFTKRVAIKTVPSGRDTEQILRRFRHERQILARLDHKNIAALLDGGVSEDGRPYFAMEYVEGERIDLYCDRLRLGLRERLQLMRQVCAAVHYAHQHLVVHRDLKPSNVLVAPDGTVKLLDFGIAKLVDPGDSDEQLTESGVLPMTTSYASPEQLRGDLVNTATDVYSLGLMLYELLAGRRAFQVGELPLLEARRRMLEEAPPPPGVNGEIDSIILMALRKEPERRYASVERLSGDLSRYLSGLPIHAQPDSFGYRARKFASRHRAAVGAMGVILLTLIGGLVVTLWQFGIARRERAKTEAVNRFLQDLLATSASDGNSTSPPQGQRTVSEVLDAATRRLETENLSANPGVKATLQQIIGSSYLSQGQYALAEQNLRAALAAQGHLFGENSPEMLRTLLSLAQLSLTKADYAGAEDFFQRRITILRREEKRGTIPPEMLASALSDFGVLRRARGNSKEAELLLREAIALKPTIAPESRGGLGQVETLLALTWLDQGKFAEAEEYARRLIAGFRALPNPATASLCSGLTLLGSILMERGELVEAQAELEEAEKLYRQLFDANYAPIYDNIRLQAQVDYLAGRLSEGLVKIDRALDQYRRHAGTQYVNFATALTVKGLILGKAGRADEAERILREAAGLRAAHLPNEHFMTALTKGALGEVLLSRRRFAEAEPLLVESYATLKQTQATDNRRVQGARQRLVELYTAWNRPELLSKLP